MRTSIATGGTLTVHERLRGTGDCGATYTDIVLTFSDEYVVVVAKTDKQSERKPK
jgi:hypothetical protein